MKAHFLLYIVATLSYFIAAFLLILGIVVIFAFPDVQRQLIGTNTYNDLGFQIYRIVIIAPLFLLSWASFLAGVFLTAFADLVRSSIRTSELLEARFGQNVKK